MVIARLSLSSHESSRRLRRRRQACVALNLYAATFFTHCGNTKHAWRTRSPESGVAIIVTKPKLGRFFREVGRPIASVGQPLASPTRERIQHFLITSKKYGY